MRKLLSANFSRLWKNREFWICVGIAMLYAVIYLLNGCRMALRDISEFQYHLDDYYFHFAFSSGGICAIFCSLFLGTEYNDGTLRNKIVVGHTRTDVYLANLLTVFMASLLFLLAWCLGAMAGVPVLGLWQMTSLQLVFYLSIAIGFLAVFSALFTAVGMLSSSKAFTVTVSMLLFLGLLIIAGNLDNQLSEPEMTSNIIVTANGMEMGDPMPNPSYVSGAKRAAYEFFLDFLPTGQCAQMAFLKIAHPLRMLLSSVFLTVVVTWGGLWAFRRKNLS